MHLHVPLRVGDVDIFQLEHPAHDPRVVDQDVDRRVADLRGELLDACPVGDVELDDPHPQPAELVGGLRSAGGADDVVPGRGELPGELQPETAVGPGDDHRRRRLPTGETCQHKAHHTRRDQDDLPSQHHVSPRYDLAHYG